MTKKKCLSGRRNPSGGVRHSPCMQVFVVDFRAPAPPTQAAFFFFATEMMNPCMWSTDLDTQQVPYVPGNTSRAAACPGCAVRLFNILAAPRGPKSHCRAACSL